jgi:uncharacterized protein with WD repeat
MEGRRRKALAYAMSDDITGAKLAEAERKKAAIAAAAAEMISVPPIHDTKEMEERQRKALAYTTSDDISGGLRNEAWRKRQAAKLAEAERKKLAEAERKKAAAAAALMSLGLGGSDELPSWLKPKEKRRPPPQRHVGPSWTRQILTSRDLSIS